MLHAADLGSGGVPLLLLHGIGGAGSSWMPVAKQLASERRVIVPDLLGFGQSPWPDVGYTVEEHLDALDRLLIERGLGDRPLDVAGHSLGAILAAELAARYGRVRRLTLVSLPYFATEEEAGHDWEDGGAGTADGDASLGGGGGVRGDVCVETAVTVPGAALCTARAGGRGARLPDA